MIELQIQLKHHEHTGKSLSESTEDSESKEGSVYDLKSMIQAKTLVLYARWSQDTGRAHYKEIINIYNKAKKLQPR